ncbi:MAG: Imm5 family immunity protein [Candidatus Promineifilaceae bacterium]
MDLPLLVQEDLDRAKAAVEAEPKHTLRPYYRQQIYRALARWPKGKEARIRLDILTAQKVLPLWPESLSERLQPGRLIQRAMDVLEGRARPEVVSREADVAWAELEEFGAQTSDEQESRAFLTALAALESTSYATGLDRMATIEIGAHEEDVHLDPWSSDAAKWASFAYAGRPREGMFNAAQQLEFWSWWLSEAIPAAWQASSSNPNNSPS